MPTEIQDTQLREDPSATRRRLQASGDWDDADKLLRRIKGRYRYKVQATGVAATLEQQIEMTKAAWDAVHDKYPPPPGTLPLQSVAAYVEKVRGAADKNGLTAEALQRFDTINEKDDLPGEAVWVKNNLDNQLVDAMDCPSRGAWTLLQHARENPSRFYEKVYLPVARGMLRQKAGTNGADDYVPSKDERKAVADLEALLRDAVAQSQELLASHGYADNSDR